MRGTVPIPKPKIPKEELASETPPQDAFLGQRKFYRKKRWVDAQIYRMEALRPGNRVKGPAIIESDATTFVVPDGFETFLDGHRLFTSRKSERGHFSLFQGHPTMSANIDKQALASATRGIVRGGETLKEHRDRLMAATKRTKHYAGLEKMELRDTNPILYNKLFSRLRAGVVDARETAKKIAASPIVEQEGELCFTLYNAAGDSILTSTGIIIHVGTMGAAIKYMIENDWESNPGVRDKDIFCNNDSLLGNVTPCDIHTIVRSSTRASWSAGSAA